jgi:probable HAF family extracellular repeat protein
LVNDSGQVAGSFDTPDRQIHGFSWTQAMGMVDLGTLGGTFSEVRGMNASGQIVGKSTTAVGNFQAYLGRRRVG